MNDYDFYKNMLEEHLLDYIPDVDEKVEIIIEAMKYSLTAGGKRIRPVLVLSTADFFGADLDEALPYAVAIEYIHTYSLIHDDLPAMDDDNLRRGKPTNHVVFGEDIAVLAGDALLNTGLEIVLNTAFLYADIPDKYRNHIRAARELAYRAGVHGMIGGQVCDVINEDIEATRELVDFIEAHKTGDLLLAPILMGLYLSEASNDDILAFTVYGRCLGKAFQVADDILDVVGDQALVGKTLGKDAEQGKCNFVSVYGLEEAKKELSDLTEKAVNALKPYGEDANFFIELVYKLQKRIN